MGPQARALSMNCRLQPMQVAKALQQHHEATMLLIPGMSMHQDQHWCPMLALLVCLLNAQASSIARAGCIAHGM